MPPLRTSPIETPCPWFMPTGVKKRLGKTTPANDDDDTEPWHISPLRFAPKDLADAQAKKASWEAAKRAKERKRQSKARKLAFKAEMDALADAFATLTLEDAVPSNKRNRSPDELVDDSNRPTVRRRVSCFIATAVFAVSSVVGLVNCAATKLKDTLKGLLNKLGTKIRPRVAPRRPSTPMDLG